MGEGYLGVPPTAKALNHIHAFHVVAEYEWM